MKDKRQRTYSLINKKALRLLADLIRISRLQQGFTLAEVAERAGISVSSLKRIEGADAKCEIGMVFEVATILRVPLFVPEGGSLTRHIQQAEEKLALLPKTAPKRKVDGVKDDF
ncbi:transcriptional regulator [Aliidiomarina minuta]|uniref:Transcriptional regulator n=1 Tax=Aliidiomarina minuta TaxID=880057 RepID=A0A432W878_9GAMM|nr:helix-turn-helix transcriptional regulator [Aliidiomarina minuta]RUO26249.1 transcriptional regulator [Aliidiomarina minuta]